MKAASSVYIYIGIFVLFVIIAQGNGGTKRLQCYVCNSIDNPGCGYPFVSSKIRKKTCAQWMDEDGNPAACLKISKTVTHRRTATVLHAVVRDCGFTSEKQYHLQEEGIDVNICINRTLHFVDHDIISRERICPCISNGCNFAPKAVRSSFSFASQMGFNIGVMIASLWLML